MEEKGARQGQGDGDAPHADGQAVHVKEGVSAPVEDAVDGDSAIGIDTHGIRTALIAPAVVARGFPNR